MFTLEAPRQFGLALLRTQDLDPIYVTLHNARLPVHQLKRLLMAYWCFYSLGAAAYLSEYEDQAFWRHMIIAAENVRPAPSGVRWPRGAERRYFRGAKCVAAMRFLAAEGPPEQLVDQLTVSSRRSNTLALERVMERVREWPLFGPWIAFKAADMLERVMGIAIEFPVDLTTIYAEPRAALDLLPGDPLENTRTLIRYFARIPAPPCGDRSCNVQEVETVLCKWKSSVNKRYWVGKDIREVRHGLVGWGETATALLAAAPEETNDHIAARYQRFG